MRRKQPDFCLRIMNLIHGPILVVYKYFHRIKTLFQIITSLFEDRYDNE